MADYSDRLAGIGREIAMEWGVSRGILVSLLVFAVSASSSGGDGRIVYDFDGVLPATASLERSSSRPDTTGIEVAPNQARWDVAAITTQATRLADAPPNTRILISRELDGVWHTVVAIGGVPALTTQIPGFDGNVQYTMPHLNERPKFTFDQPYGWIKSAELLRDGTVLLHGHDARGDHRSATTRTTLSTFANEGAFEVVRISDYSAPNTRLRLPTLSPPEFTRTTYLPNLDIEVSSPVDYRGLGLVSKHDASNGRSLGYASSDGGRSYVPVIDTDDPRLGQQLVGRAKHLHHLEPFEWFRGEEWGIGVIGLLGDESVQAGQIMSRYFTPDFRNDPIAIPPQDHESDDSREPEEEGTADSIQPVQWRFKRIGLHLATDLFPINNSERPGHPLRYLFGADASQSGIVEATFVGEQQIDRMLYRPCVTFPDAYGKTNVCRHPYVFQIGRLMTGSLIAPTNEGRSEWDPNSIWVSDPTGEHWTTAFSQHIDGWERALPLTGGRFWTHAVGGSADTGDQLWEIEQVIARQGLLLGAEAFVAAATMPISSGGAFEVTDVSSNGDRPDEVPDSVPVHRIYTEVAPAGTLLSDNSWMNVTGAPGEIAQVAFWIKPGRLDMRSPRLRIGLRLRLTDNTEVPAKGNWLGLDVNCWTRVIESVEIPAPGLASVKIEIRTIEDDAAVDLPLDYLMTEPRVIIAAQPTVQMIANTGSTSADRLTLSLPALGSSWTVMAWVTEEPALALSLIDELGAGAEVLPRNTNGGSAFNGIDCHLESRWWNGTSGSATGLSGPLDMFFPAQSVVAFVNYGATGNLEIFVSRGMGTLESIGTISAGSWSPSELRFGSADWSLVTQGVAHRVIVWPNSARSLEDIASELRQFAPAPSVGATDLDQDGHMTIHDVMVWVEANRRRGAQAMTRADVNRNGVLDTLDLVEVIRSTFGSSTSVAPSGAHPLKKVRALDESSYP